MIDTVKQKVSDILETIELSQLMVFLRRLFIRSENEEIRRKSKELRDLLFNERYASIRDVKEEEIE